MFRHININVLVLIFSWLYLISYLTTPVALTDEVFNERSPCAVYSGLAYEAITPVEVVVIGLDGSVPIWNTPARSNGTTIAVGTHGIATHVARVETKYWYCITGMDGHWSGWLPAEVLYRVTLHSDNAGQQFKESVIH